MVIINRIEYLKTEDYTYLRDLRIKPHTFLFFSSTVNQQYSYSLKKLELNVF